MADGSVKIDVQLLLNGADKEAKALKGDLQGIDVKTSAADHAKLLADAIKRASTAAKQGETAQNALRTSLESQAKTWDKLADAQEKAGLKTSSQVSKLNSLKAQLASTSVAAEQASQKFKEAVIAEGENSDAAKDAARSYNELKGEQAALGLQVSALEKRFGGLTPKMAAAADKANAIGDKFQSLGSKISSVGNKMTVGLSAPIAAGFAIAGKAAITFDSQIQSMGSLLDDGSVSASTLKSELKGLGDASKSWSTQYGVSTSSINDGMSELIKKGYTYNQVLGAMPSILDAARASGDDFNSVMSVSTSVLEQFGLKSNNTATMLKNTQRVTDSLSYVANKTSAGFSDMGEAMEYVGPVANGLHMSLEQTAAAIGLMSNQGIEGEKAGTALRGALSQLMNPSKQNEIGFKRLGISIKDFKNGSIGLPEIIDSIKKSSKGMTAQQLQSNLALAFGTEAVSGMNILVNEGGDALRNMTKETQGATGYTKKLAETMNNTAQANVDKFKSSLNVLAITAGQKLLPQITELVKSGTDLVKWFNDLDDGTQKTILKTLALTAAVGPLLSGIGKMSTGVGALVHGGTSAVTFLSRFASGAGKTKTESEMLGEMLELLKGKTGTVTTGLETVTGAVAKTGAGMAAAETGSAGFLASLAPIAPALIGVGVAAAAGIAYWELYGKEAQASSERASRWGTDIGKAADTAASKMTDYERDVDIALDNNSDSASENSKKIVKAFDGMTASAKAASKAQTDAAKKLADSVGGAAGAALEKEAAAEEKSRNTAISKMKGYAKQVESITKESRDKNVELTADQRTQINNLQMKMAEEQVKTLGVSAKQQRQILKAELGKTSTASAKELAAMAKTIGDASYQEQSNYQKKLQKINSAEGVSQKAKNAAIEAAEQQHSDKMTALGRGYINVAREQGESNKAILQDLTTQYGFTQSEAEAALSGMEKAAKSSANGVSVSLSGLSDYVLKAANDWNSIVLDPKTGKIKTNAQEEVNKALQSSEQWDNIELLVKEGKMSTNATAMVETGLIAQGRWNDALWVAKNAKLNDQTKAALISALASNGQWNATDYKTAELLAVNKSGKPVIQALQDLGQWDQLTPKQQQMIAQAKTKAALKAAVKDVGEWNALSPKLKRLLANADSVRKETKSGESVLYSYGRNNPSKKTLIAAFSDPGYGGTINALNTFGRTNPKNKNPQASYSSSGQYDVLTGLASFNSFLNQGQDIQLHRSVLYSGSGSNKAHGDTYFSGGLATVNDQYGSVYREAIRLPTGETFSFKERNVTGYFPRGTEIVPAAKSLQSGLVPRYANGTGGQLTDAIDRASLSPIWTMTAESSSSFVPRTMNLSMDSKSTAAFGAITTALEKMQGALIAMTTQPVADDAVIRIENVTELDRKVLSRQIAPDIRVNLDRIDRINSRRKGITQ